MRGRGGGFDERLIKTLLNGAAGLSLRQPITWRDGPCAYGTAPLGSDTGRALDLKVQVCDVSWSITLLDRTSNTRLICLCGTARHLNRRDGVRFEGPHVHVWTAEFGDNDAREAWWPVDPSVRRDSYRAVTEGFCDALSITRDPGYSWTDAPQEPPPTTTTDGSAT